MQILFTILLSALLGSMIFFVVVVVSSIHKTLEQPSVVRLTDAIFPKYFLWGIIVSAMALLVALCSNFYDAIFLTLILIGFIFNRQILMKKMIASEVQLPTDDPEQFQHRHKKSHKISVIINSGQMVLLCIIIIRPFLFL